MRGEGQLTVKLHGRAIPDRPERPCSKHRSHQHIAHASAIQLHNTLAAHASAIQLPSTLRALAMHSQIQLHIHTCTIARTAAHIGNRMGIGGNKVQDRSISAITALLCLGNLIQYQKFKCQLNLLHAMLISTLRSNQHQETLLRKHSQEIHLQECFQEARSVRNLRHVQHLTHQEIHFAEHA